MITFEIEKQDMIFALLYACNQEPISGFTELDRMMFLMSKNKHLKKLVTFEFDIGRFGPYSVDVFDWLETFVTKKYVKVDFETMMRHDLSVVDEKMIEEECDYSLPFNAYKLKRYVLTDFGLKIGKKIWDSLSNKQREEIAKIKSYWSRHSIAMMIHFIYQKYPKESGILICNSLR